MEVQVFEIRPPTFEAEAEVAGCYIEFEGKVLLLRKGGDKPEAGSWSLPGGKGEKGEPTFLTAIRELKEETGILISQEQLRNLGVLYVQKPYFIFNFHLFQVSLPHQPEVQISPEHTEYCWANREDLERLPLMGSLKEALLFIQQHAK